MWLKFDFSMLGGLCINFGRGLAPSFTHHTNKIVSGTKHQSPIVDIYRKLYTNGFGYIQIYICKFLTYSIVYILSLQFC